MMFPVIFTVFVFLASLEEGSGLKCLQCKSKYFEGRCRLGQRNHHSAQKSQSCFGQNAKCFALASVTEEGESTFERGCTTQKMCGEHEESDIEFCFTCQSTFCNYDVMQLDKEVEDYLTEVMEYEKSLIAKTSTTSSTTTTTTQSPSVKPKRRHLNNSSRYVSSRNGGSRQDLVFNHSQQNDTINPKDNSTSVVSQVNPLQKVSVEIANDLHSLKSNVSLSNGAHLDLMERIQFSEKSQGPVVVNNNTNHNAEIMSTAKHEQVVKISLSDGISGKTNIFNDPSIEMSYSNNTRMNELQNSVNITS